MSSGSIRPEMPQPLPGQLGIHLRTLITLAKQAQDPKLDPVKRLGLLVMAETEVQRGQAAALYLARQAPTTPRIADEGPSEAAS